MRDAEKLSLEAISRFVEASEEIRFESKSRAQVYGWVERVLIGQKYARQGKAARGLVRRYIEKMTGMSRAQITRLIGRYTATGQVRPTVRRGPDHPGTVAIRPLLRPGGLAGLRRQKPRGTGPAAAGTTTGRWSLAVAR